MLEKADDELKRKGLLSALSDFRCEQDPDVESFLQLSAETYLTRGWCSVYLVLNEVLFLEGKLKIEAYFTLSHKILLVPDGISKTKVKQIDGLRKNAPALHFVLIGHLGKYVKETGKDTYIRSEVTGKEILDYAFEVICASGNLIPCRCVLVECNDKEKVRKVYEDYCFKYFQKDGEHNQYYKILS